MLTFEPGLNFRIIKFYAEIRLLGILYSQILIKVYWVINKIEKLYTSLKPIYEIFRTECGTEYLQKNTLQATVKTVNNTAGPNGLVSIIIISKIIMDLLPIFNQIKRAAVIDNIIIKLRKFVAKKKLNHALIAKSGPNLSD